MKRTINIAWPDIDFGGEVKVLIAIDDSPYSVAALDSVMQRPWPPISQFKVITVVEPFHPEYAGWQTNYVPLAVEAQKALNESATNLVKTAEQSLKTVFGKDKVFGEVVEGYIKDRILEIAKQWHADLIVVGSHGRRGFTRFLLGSVSEAIAAHADCSVEIVRMPDPKRESLPVG
jgi:nucleotide-binding universal stress UspA family protein